MGTTGLGSFGERRLKTCERPYGEVETLLDSADDGDGRGKNPAEGRLQTQSKDIVPARLKELIRRHNLVKVIT